MNKILLSLFCFLMLGTYTYATDLIGDYIVQPKNVPLNQELSISGVFIDDINDSANRICSFYITTQDGNAIYRLSDQITDLTGNFYAFLEITEPRLKRGETYYMKTICGDAEIQQDFTVENRETIFQPVVWDFKWITDLGNINPLIWIGGGFFVVILIFFAARGLINGVYYGIRRRF